MPFRPFGAALAALLAVTVGARPATAQTTSQRGFVEVRGTVYPQTNATDETRLLGDAQFRQDVAWHPATWLTLAGGIDARVDSHDRVDSRIAGVWSDRGLRRPPVAVRRASVAIRGRGVTVEIGKQLIRWGKADVLIPTDRFAPRDNLEVVDNEFLGVSAVRVTYERGANTIDAIWQPTFTPSRLPIAGQRWATLPANVAAAMAAAAASPTLSVSVSERPVSWPTRTQYGIRWNHVAEGFEFSVSYFDGLNHLPRVELVPGAIPLQFDIARTYVDMKMAGVDLAVPTRWFTVKGEAGYFASREPRTDEYLMYVVQIERQKGDWLFVGGYAGEAVTNRRSSAGLTTDGAPVTTSAVNLPFDRGLTRTFLGRASYTIDVNRSLAFQGAVRQDGRGYWIQAEFSRSYGQHWRTTVRANGIGGSPDDFLGQYRRNSSLDLMLRYSY